MSNFLNRNIEEIYLILGRKCNLFCHYCIQKSFNDDRNELTSINPDIFKFIKQIANESCDKLINIVFYGGESLLYFDTIKFIISQIENIPNLTYSLISNGKLLNKEIVYYFNKYKEKLRPVFSWDGPNSIKTRGYDLVKEKRDLLYKIENLITITSIITAETYPLDIVESVNKFREEYLEKTKRDIRFYTNPIFISHKTELANFDLEKLSKEINILLDQYLENKINPIGRFMIENFMFGRSLSIYNEYNGDFSKVKNLCGECFERLSIDLNGNLYNCSDSNIKISTIYDDFSTFYRNHNCVNESPPQKCKECNINDFCLGYCKLVDNDNFLNLHCKTRHAILDPIKSRLLKILEK